MRGTDTMIYDPLEEYDKRLRVLHSEKTGAFFDDLVKRSGVDAEKNRKTVLEYERCRESSKKLRTKRNWLRFLRVLLILTILLIPLVILKLTPKIRALLAEIENADKKAEELLKEAYSQMQPLNSLFTDRDALEIIEQTMPLLSYEPCFSVKQEADMMINYDFGGRESAEQTTLDVLAGHYNDNPFLFENVRVHRMGTEVYHGYKTISWTEHYTDSNGKRRTRVRTQTLHASVSKPKPFYSTQVVLNYCAQGGPELSFTRDATNLDEKNDRQIERYVKRGERKLKRLTDKAVSENKDFVSMSNTDFEVLFDALDRTDEVEFRTLFTPLAQTNMVDLIRSQVGYGDDFKFIKRKRTNKIVTEHSQGRKIKLYPEDYTSYSFDIIKESFNRKNTEYFKAVYFDFAPLWAIPMYQERPVHSLKPIPSYTQQYSVLECEALANMLDKSHVIHPSTKTEAIIKASYISSNGKTDNTKISAYSYDMIPRVDIVRVWGGDGRCHNVSVPWEEYIPLEKHGEFGVCTDDAANGKSVLARRGNLCIFKK